MFTTPENNDFYSRWLYPTFDRHLQQIRLLRVHPERLDAWSLVDAYPNWVADPRTDAYQFHQTAINPRGDISDIDLEDFICCELLEPFDLETAESYAALSYCCGPPNKTRKILVDGYIFNAFANLEHSLDMFRELHNKTSASKNPIWTDQVCINQSDIVERSQQVGIMWDIYHKAEMVYAVLSTPKRPKYSTDFGKAIEAARQFLEELARRTSGVHHAIRSNEDAAISNYGLPSATDEKAITQAVGFRTTEMVLTLLFEIIAAKWWSRAWTLQEFMAAKSTFFLIHKEEIQETELSQLFHAFFPPIKLSVLYCFMIGDITKDEEECRNFKILGDILERGTLSWASNIVYETLKARLDSTHNVRTDGSTQNEVKYPSINGNRVFGILSAASNRTATDERDMVYATAAILGKAYRINADYSPRTTKETVLTMLARRLIEVDNSPHILDYAWKYAGRGIPMYSAEKWKPSPGLPTWIPDWTRVPLTEHEVWGNDYSGSIEGMVFAEHDRGVGIPFATAQFVNDATISEHLILRTKGFRVCVLGETAGSIMRQHGSGVVHEPIYRTSLPNSACALGQAWSSPGDELWSLHDSDFLYVLRRKVEENAAAAYELIGRAQLFRDHSENESHSPEHVEYLRAVIIEDEVRDDLESYDWSVIWHRVFGNGNADSMMGRPLLCIGREKLWVDIV